MKFGENWITVPELAKELGCNQTKILNWIKAGELEAVNMATDAITRPRHKISETAFIEFCRRRSQPPSMPTVKEPRLKKTAGRDFFPDKGK